MYLFHAELGHCGNCDIRVVSGSENLAPQTQDELDALHHTHGPVVYWDPEIRRLCHVKVEKDGAVEIEDLEMACREIRPIIPK